MLLNKQVNMMIPLILQRLLVSSIVMGSALFVLLGTGCAANNVTTSDGMEVLTRGPIHEAFADVSLDETPSGPTISRPVPEPINEIPPEIRPEGNQIEWIPGYWSWDEDQNDFIWVSGVWRDVPPGRQWVAGYWQEVESGNRYISGYWSNNPQAATQYLPPPPQPLEAGPNSPPTGPDYLWMEGNWIWSHNGYAWQSGYWYEPKPNMIWTPSHYVWTPRGSIFIMGYWDYQPGLRGVMYAPLYYPRPVYRHRGYFYRPHVVLDTDTVFLSLFVRRGYHHYYFGDYRDRRYERRGFRPWSHRDATRYGHDPFYRNYREHRMRDNRRWENNSHPRFDSRREIREERRRQRSAPVREHIFEQSPHPNTQGIGKMFGDSMENNDRQRPERFNRGHAERRRELGTTPRGKNQDATSGKKFDRNPQRRDEARQAREEGQEPVRLRPFGAPGRTEEERQENGDQVNQATENQRFQQQDGGNSQGQRLQPWHGRSRQRDGK